MSRSLPTREALTEEAAALAAKLEPRATGATLITLSGELGAGKTSFTQDLARTLGVTESVTSPTFVLEKIYQLSPEAGRGFERLVHIDAYRLDGGAALAPLGFDEIMRTPANLVVLEWPERVADALPQPAYAISLTVEADGTRTISFTYA